MYCVSQFTRFWYHPQSHRWLSSLLIGFAKISRPKCDFIWIHQKENSLPSNQTQTYNFKKRYRYTVAFDTSREWIRLMQTLINQWLHLLNLSSHEVGGSNRGEGEQRTGMHDAADNLINLKKGKINIVKFTNLESRKEWGYRLILYFKGDPRTQLTTLLSLFSMLHLIFIRICI